jgi:hypothetical protein
MWELVITTTGSLHNDKDCNIGSNFYVCAKTQHFNASSVCKTKCRGQLSTWEVYLTGKYVKWRRKELHNICSSLDVVPVWERNMSRESITCEWWLQIGQALLIVSSQNSGNVCLFAYYIDLAYTEWSDDWWRLNWEGFAREHLERILPAVLGPGVYSASNRNEY